MAQETEPRVDEQPSTHKRKLQIWVFVSFGVILMFLGALTVANIYQKMNNKNKAPEEVVSTQPDATKIKAPTDSRSDFDKLVENRRPRIEEPKGLQAATLQPTGLQTAELNPQPDIGQQFDVLAGIPAAGNEEQRGKSRAPKLSAEEKALQQWAAREKLRALNSAQAEWGFEIRKTSANGQSHNNQPEPTADLSKRFQAMNRPLPETGSLDERRLEVRRRIEEAKKLRQKVLDQSRQAGKNPGQLPSVQPEQKQLEQLKERFDQPPADVAGYTKENAYNADIAGKMKLPAGTVIPAVWAHKSMSDYAGSPSKGIVSQDVYDVSKEFVLIPKGSELMIKVHRIQNVNEAIQSRMGFTVPLLVLPNGNKVDFSKAAGLDREGIGAIKDQVDHHFLEQFFGVVAYAIVSSETSREGTGIGTQRTFEGDVGESLRKETSPLIQKYINLVPTITIRPGQSFRVMLEDEIYLEPWSDVYAQYVN